MNANRETDILGATRATKKLDYWKDMQSRGITTVTGSEDGIVYDVIERIEYWTKQVKKYTDRIEKHIADFEKIKDPFQFLKWVSEIVETIKLIINTLIK